MKHPPPHILHQKLKGASLFYALTFTLIIAVTITSIIGLVFLHTEYVNRNKYIGDRIELVNKATQLSLQGIPSTEINELLSLVNPTSDSLVVSEAPWGIYDLHKVQFVNRQDLVIKSDVALMGYSSDQMAKTGVFVMDDENPLIVSGTTKLEGVSYLTKTELKPGSIEGYGYRNKELLYGPKRIHANEQTIDMAPLSEIKAVWDNGVSSSTIGRDSIVQSFGEEPLIIRGDTLRLNDVHIGGHVYIIGNKAILIGEGVSISNAIAIAPEIYIDSKEKIQIQAFSSNRLEVFSGSSIAYPSALVLMELGIDTQIPLLEKKKAELTIAGNTRFEGVLVGGKALDGTPMGKITVNEDVNIKGYVFNQGPTELRSDLNGSVFTHHFEHISPRQRRYVNYLFDASINPSGISDVILHAEMADFNTNKSILTWLENS